MAYSQQLQAVSKVTIILEKCSDWDDWFPIVERFATEHRIWHLVNPSLPAQPAGLPQSKYLNISDFNAEATSTADLTKKEFNHYQSVKKILNIKINFIKNNKRHYRNLILTLSSLSHDLIT
jgi:hypothetical protein